MKNDLAYYYLKNTSPDRGGGAPATSDRWSPDDVGTALGLSGGEKQAQGTLGCAWAPQRASD